MSTDDRIPFNDDQPRRAPDPDFEIGEDALDPRGPFAEQPTQEQAPYEEYEPTKIMPAYRDEPAPNYASDAPTQRIGAQQPAGPARERSATSAGNAEYTAPNAAIPHAAASEQYGHPPRSGRELTSAGWSRLLFGGLLLLIATWLLVHGALGFLDLEGLQSLLNPFTLIGAPALLASLLILPGPAGGKVVGILFAALAYGALILPGLLEFNPSLSPEVPAPVVLSGPATVLLGFMTWLSVRGKRPLAWSLLPLPVLIAVIWALAAGVAGVAGIIYGGDWLLMLYGTGEAAWLDWIERVPLDIVRSTFRFAMLGACVIPAILLAWPFARARIARERLR